MKRGCANTPLRGFPSSSRRRLVIRNLDLRFSGRVAPMAVSSDPSRRPSGARFRQPDLLPSRQSPRDPLAALRTLRLRAKPSRRVLPHLQNPGESILTPRRQVRHAAKGFFVGGGFRTGRGIGSAHRDERMGGSELRRGDVRGFGFRVPGSEVSRWKAGNGKRESLIGSRGFRVSGFGFRVAWRVPLSAVLNGLRKTAATSTSRAVQIENRRSKIENPRLQFPCSALASYATPPYPLHVMLT